MPETTHSTPLDPVDTQRHHGSEDAALVAAIRGGEERAFERMVRELGPKVLAFVSRITHNQSDAEDVLQETFLSVFRNIHTFDGRSSLSTWVHRIAVNAALTKARRRSDQPADIDSLLPRFESGFHQSPPQPLQARSGLAQSDAARQSILAAIDKLPDDFRQVVHMHAISGISLRGIASALDISEALVRQRLHRARLALMNLLQQQGDLMGAGSTATNQTKTAHRNTKVSL